MVDRVNAERRRWGKGDNSLIMESITDRRDDIDGRESSGELRKDSSRRCTTNSES